jgi:hypothetical protein
VSGLLSEQVGCLGLASVLTRTRKQNQQTSSMPLRFATHGTARRTYLVLPVESADDCQRRVAAARLVAMQALLDAQRHWLTRVAGDDNAWLHEKDTMQRHRQHRHHHYDYDAIIRKTGWVPLGKHRFTRALALPTTTTTSRSSSRSSISKVTA